MSFEIEISRKSDWRLFDAVAEMLVKEFNGKALERLDGLEQRCLGIAVNGIVLTLHLEHHCGISLFSEDERAEKLIEAIAEHHKRKSFETEKRCNERKS